MLQYMYWSITRVTIHVTYVYWTRLLYSYTELMAAPCPTTSPSIPLTPVVTCLTLDGVAHTVPSTEEETLYLISSVLEGQRKIQVKTGQKRNRREKQRVREIKRGRCRKEMEERHKVGERNREKYE